MVTQILQGIPKQPAEVAEVSLDMEQALRCYIPSGVKARLDADQYDWLAELRRVTVLFVKLDSLTYSRDVEFDCDDIHHVLCFMQTVIFKYEGMVRQFLVDDKGTVLIAAFGVPPFSHEDDSIRGVQAAVEIHKSTPFKVNFHMNFHSKR